MRRTGEAYWNANNCDSNFNMTYAQVSKNYESHEFIYNATLPLISAKCIEQLDWKYFQSHTQTEFPA